MNWKKLVLRVEHQLEKIVPGLITCAEADEFLDDYLDGDLSPKIRARFERHIKMCAACKSYLEAYRRTVELARSSGEPASTPAMPDDLKQAILFARGETKE